MVESLEQVNASITIALGIEQNVGFASRHDVLSDFLDRRVVEMHPAAFVVGIGRVVPVACAGSLMDNDRGEVVNASRIGTTRFRTAVKNELRQIQRIYREIDAQIDFSPGNFDTFFILSEVFNIFRLTLCNNPTRTV